MSSAKAHGIDFVISELPHSKQRYETVGDWIPGEPVRIRVSKMKDRRYTFLVALHELVEYELCSMRGVSDQEVVRFDKKFEEERLAGLHAEDEEPGDDPGAPYKEEHGFATMVERLVARELGVSWSDYEETTMSLSSRRRIPVKEPIRHRK